MILMKAIAIQDKKEETKRLAEFIQMEQKLAESIRTFEEDKERYKQYIEQLGVEAERIEEEVKRKINEK